MTSASPDLPTEDQILLRSLVEQSVEAGRTLEAIEDEFCAEFRSVALLDQSLESSRASK